MTIASIQEVSHRATERDVIGYDVASHTLVLPPEIVPHVQTALEVYQASGKDVMPLEGREDGGAHLPYGHLNAVIGGLRQVWEMQRQVPELAARTQELATKIGLAALRNNQEATLLMWRMSHEIALQGAASMLGNKPASAE